MTVNISTKARNEGGKAIVSLIDQGSAKPNGRIEIRDGEKPTNPQTGVGATNLLSTLDLSLPSFGAFNNGVSLANAIKDDLSVKATGVASWFRIYDRNNAPILDGDITIIGGGGDIEFDSISSSDGKPVFIIGGIVSITLLTAIMPE